MKYTFVFLSISVSVSSSVWEHIFLICLRDYTETQPWVVVAKGRPN